MKTAVEKSFPDADGAKGLEKLILKLCLFVVKFTFALDKIFYGKPIPKIRSFTKNNTPKNPLDLGIIPILRILASVDYCQIITYALSKVPKGKFDPKTPPKTDDPKLVKIKWQIQKAAYDTQLIRDTYEEGLSEEIAGKTAIMGALRLYLDFINIFITLLQLLGDRK